MLQTLVIPSSFRFANRISLRRSFSVRAFTSSSSSDYEDQSRGGLPRFYSETLPHSKAFSLILRLFYFINSFIMPQITFLWKFALIWVIGVVSIWENFQFISFHLIECTLYTVLGLIEMGNKLKFLIWDSG
jgi:hypothetical protein